LPCPKVTSQEVAKAMKQLDGYTRQLRIKHIQELKTTRDNRKG